MVSCWGWVEYVGELVEVCVVICWGWVGWVGENERDELVRMSWWVGGLLSMSCDVWVSWWDCCAALPLDALSCRSLSAKEPSITGLLRIYRVWVYIRSAVMCGWVGEIQMHLWISSEESQEHLNRSAMNGALHAPWIAVGLSCGWAIWWDSDVFVDILRGVPRTFKSLCDDMLRCTQRG